MDSTRRAILATGAAAAAVAAVPGAFAQSGTKFYEKGGVRVHYRETGSGFPLLVIPGGGLNSDMSNLTGSSPFNPMERYVLAGA